MPTITREQVTAVVSSRAASTDASGSALAISCTAPAKMHTRPGVVPARRGVLPARRGEYASSPGQHAFGSSAEQCWRWRSQNGSKDWWSQGSRTSKDAEGSEQSPERAHSRGHQTFRANQRCFYAIAALLLRRLPQPRPGVVSSRRGVGATPRGRSVKPPGRPATSPGRSFVRPGEVTAAPAKRPRRSPAYGLRLRVLLEETRGYVIATG